MHIFCVHHAVFPYIGDLRQDLAAGQITCHEALPDGDGIRQQHLAKEPVLKAYIAKAQQHQSQKKSAGKALIPQRDPDHRRQHITAQEKPEIGKIGKEGIDEDPQGAEGALLPAPRPVQPDKEPDRQRYGGKAHAEGREEVQDAVAKACQHGQSLFLSL